MPWKIIITESFSKEFKKYKKDRNLANALDKKMQRLKENPDNVGKYLCGKLSSLKSTRIYKKFRLVFKISEIDKSVLLIGIDHRKFNYQNF